jgi:DNA-binding SARP family transcriptional activator
VIGSPSSAGAVIQVDSSDRANLSPLGVDFTPAGLSARTAEVLADQLDELETEGEPIEQVAMLPGLIEPVQAVMAAVDQVLQQIDGTAPELEQYPQDARPEDAPPRSSADDIDSFGQLTLVPEDATETEPGGEAEEEPSLLGDRLLIRVLGVPRVECSVALGQRDTSLLAFVACNGGSATDDQVIDAVWGGKAMGKPSFYNRLSRIRNALGGVLTSRDKHDPLVRVEGVATDIALMSELINRSAEEASGDELQRLLEALAWVDGRPFDAAGYEWAFTHQFHAQTSELIESAALRVVELALDAGDHDAARFAIKQGLKALPLQEPLYRAKMRLEAASNNLAGVKETYDELVLLLDDLDDGYRPSAETARLLISLTADRQSA